METCKSCGEGEVVDRNLCLPCVRDYRYSMYRKSLHKRQAKAGKFFSHEGKRWSREERKLIRQKIKVALLTGAHKEIRARKLVEIFEINRGFANKILQELMRDGLIVMKGHNQKSYYEVVKC